MFENNVFFTDYHYFQTPKLQNAISKSHVRPFYSHKSKRDLGGPSRRT